MDPNPQVTIILATHNRAHLIGETLASIQNQTYTNFECLIIDDAGTDNTLEVINPLLDSDPRFTHHKRRESYKRGLPGSRNYGLDLAKGDYIIFFDDDDIVHPQNLESCITAFQRLTTVDFCCFRMKSFTGNTSGFSFQNETASVERNFDKNDILKILTHELPIASCSVMWKKDCFDLVRFEEDLQYAEEWECYSRMLSNNRKGMLISNVLYFNRKHPSSNTGEFFRNDPIRLASKKAAILLVVKNLAAKNLLSPALLKYLCGLAISYRDWKLAHQILKETDLSKKEKRWYRLKYYVFPLWRVYYKLNKKLFSQNQKR